MRVIDSAFSDKVIDNGTDHGFWQNGNQTIVLETISGDTFSIQKVDLGQSFGATAGSHGPDRSKSRPDCPVTSPKWKKNR